MKCDDSIDVTETIGALSTDGVSTRVTYSCPTGASLAGQVVNVCESDGTWSTAEPATCGMNVNLIFTTILCVYIC